MRAVHAAVLATRRTPGLAALYGGLYRGGTAACAASLARLPGVAGVILHRGLARGKPDAGVSDADLILLRRPLEPAEEPAWLGLLASRWSGLRSVFPPLGDLWVAEPAELALYLRRGGLRAWEDPPHWRALAGTLPDRPAYAASAAKRSILDPWTWAFVSFMDLSRRVWSPGPDLPAKRDADLRKMYRETARLCLAVLGGAPPAPREADLPGPDPGRAAPPELWLAAAGLLGEASRAALGRLPRSGTQAPAIPASEDLEALRRASGAEQVVLTPPYHVVAVLGEEADGPAFTRAAEGLARSGRPEAPLVLTPASWALALQSSYLGLPSPEPAPATAGLFAGWTPAAAGAARDLPLLAPALRREAAAEAAAWMLLWWRALWAHPAASNRFVLHHLYSRGLALRALLTGRADAEGPLAAALAGWSRREPAECVDGLPRALLAREHAALLAGLMRRLGSAVEAA